MEENIKGEEDFVVVFITEIDENDKIVMVTMELEKENNEMDERKNIDPLKIFFERNMGGSLLERQCKADLEKTTKEITEYCESDIVCYLARTK